jgi:S1-C subfamily serine protease
MKPTAFFKSILPALALTVAPLTLRALPEPEARAGREIVKRYADSIVGVEMVVTVKMNMGDRAMPPRENKVDVNGTIVASSGLTVTSLAAIDPRTQLAAMTAMMGASGQRMEISETDYKEVKLRLADGSEVPAKVVLKDADLDLAFIAPVADASGAKREFTPVKLDDAAEGVLLNTYILVARAPKALQRVPLVRPTLVTGIVEKPRRLYLLNDQQMGCPVFDQQGRILGISVQNLNGGRSNGLVVLPAADVAEIARQAATAKPVEEAKPAEEAPAKG